MGLFRTWAVYFSREQKKNEEQNKCNLLLRMRTRLLTVSITMMMTISGCQLWGVSVHNCKIVLRISCLGGLWCPPTLVRSPTWDWNDLVKRERSWIRCRLNLHGDQDFRLVFPFSLSGYCKALNLLLCGLKAYYCTTTMRPYEILLRGLKTAYLTDSRSSEALRHPNMRPQDILLWGPKAYNYVQMAVWAALWRNGWTVRWDAAVHRGQLPSLLRRGASEVVQWGRTSKELSSSKLITSDFPWPAIWKQVDRG